jgi:hypothetical protein
MRAVAKLLNCTRLCRLAAMAALAMSAFISASAIAGEEPIYNGSGVIAFIGYSESGSQRWRAIDYPNFEKRMKIYAPNIAVHFYDPEGNAATQLSMGAVGDRVEAEPHRPDDSVQRAARYPQ